MTYLLPRIGSQVPHTNAYLPRYPRSAGYSDLQRLAFYSAPLSRSILINLPKSNRPVSHAEHARETGYSPPRPRLESNSPHYFRGSCHLSIRHAPLPDLLSDRAIVASCNRRALIGRSRAYRTNGNGATWRRGIVIKRHHIDRHRVPIRRERDII